MTETETVVEEDDPPNYRALPEEIRAKWPEIVKVTGRLRDWFVGYTEGVSEVKSSFPKEAPSVADSYELPDPNGRRGDPPCGIIGYRVGSFLIFRAPKFRAKELEIEHDTDNERLVEDGDHTIVVVLL